MRRLVINTDAGVSNGPCFSFTPMILDDTQWERLDRTPAEYQSFVQVAKDWGTASTYETIYSGPDGVYRKRAWHSKPAGEIWYKLRRPQ